MVERKELKNSADKLDKLDRIKNFIVHHILDLNLDQKKLKRSTAERLSNRPEQNQVIVTDNKLQRRQIAKVDQALLNRQEILDFMTSIGLSRETFEQKYNSLSLCIKLQNDYYFKPSFQELLDSFLQEDLNVWSFGNSSIPEDKINHYWGEEMQERFKKFLILISNSYKFKDLKHVQGRSQELLNDRKNASKVLNLVELKNFRQVLNHDFTKFVEPDKQESNLNLYKARLLNLLSKVTLELLDFRIVLMEQDENDLSANGKLRFLGSTERRFYPQNYYLNEYIRSLKAFRLNPSLSPEEFFSTFSKLIDSSVRIFELLRIWATLLQKSGIKINYEAIQDLINQLKFEGLNLELSSDIWDQLLDAATVQNYPHGFNTVKK